MIGFPLMEFIGVGRIMLAEIARFINQRRRTLIQEKPRRTFARAFLLFDLAAPALCYNLKKE